MRLSGSAKERPSLALGEGEGEARSVVFYEGLRFWEARSVRVLRVGEALGGQMQSG